MRPLKSFFIGISKRQKIQLTVAGIVIIVLIITLIFLRMFNILAAGNDITNTAMIYYTENNVQKSAQSNTVTTTVTNVSPGPSPQNSPTAILSHKECNLQAQTCVTVQGQGTDTCSQNGECQNANASANITVQLGGRSDPTDTTGRLEVYTVGTTTLVTQASNIALSNLGQAALNLSGLTVGTHYDFRFKVSTYLKNKISDTAYTNNMVLDFGTLIAGNLDNQENINIYDFQIMADDWGKTDSIANIDKQNTVNIYDFSILADNWGKSDQ